MPSLAEVRRQIEANKDRYIFWTQKEIRALPEILEHDESVKAITSGLMNNATWLAVCTEKRIIFLHRGMFFGLRQVQIPLERVQAIDHEFTIVFGSIRIWDGASAFTISMVLKSSIIPFVKVTQEQMNIAKRMARGDSLAEPRGMPASYSQPETATDIATQLSKLAELKEKGYLTEEEFQAQKKKLLTQN